VLLGVAGGENLPTDLSESEELLDLSTDRYWAWLAPLGERGSIIDQTLDTLLDGVYDCRAPFTACRPGDGSRLSPAETCDGPQAAPEIPTLEVIWRPLPATNRKSAALGVCPNAARVAKSY